MTKIRFTRRTAEDRAKQQGDKGDRGPKGDKGDPGDSAYQLWLDAGNHGTKKDFLRKLRGQRGPRGDRGPTGGGGIGPPGPPGPAGDASVPRSTTIVRDENGRVASVALEDGPTWALSRSGDGSVASLTDSSTLVEVDRDGEGVVTGTTVSDV